MQHFWKVLLYFVLAFAGTSLAARVVVVGINHVFFHDFENATQSVWIIKARATILVTTWLPISVSSMVAGWKYARLEVDLPSKGKAWRYALIFAGVSLALPLSVTFAVFPANAVLYLFFLAGGSIALAKSFVLSMLLCWLFFMLGAKIALKTPSAR